MATNVPVTLDTPIVIKIQFQGSIKKFKIPLRELGAQVLPDKLRELLRVQPDDNVIFERFSDSAGCYVTLDRQNPQVFKTLFRAAKAKLKLRLRATIPGQEETAEPAAHVARPAPGPSVEATLTDTVPNVPLSNFRTASVESVAGSPASSMTTLQTKNEAPVPASFTADLESLRPIRKTPHELLAGVFGRDDPISPNRAASLAFRPKVSAPYQAEPCVVYCNNCNLPVDDEHFHCGTCDEGDYDLCPTCVQSGQHCAGSDHWLVKRFVKNGRIVHSTTERVGPKPRSHEKQEAAAPLKIEEQTLDVEHPEPRRTCNSCVNVIPESECFNCTNCEDYDHCTECHLRNKHGHHPGHIFQPVHSDGKQLTISEFLCKAGRNVRHAAVCDGCNKPIYGVRHKCLTCPDWDYCHACIHEAKVNHARHRFVPIYDPLPEPVANVTRHYGIYCDGPLCKNKSNISYIEGVRYKCAVCHDTDFCANCEAIPSNRHNRTHPLIKFNTPVRSVSVTTWNEDKNGQSLTKTGDREPARKSTATETTPAAPSVNAATQVQTILDVKPSEELPLKTIKEKIEIRDLLSEAPNKPVTAHEITATKPITIEPRKNANGEALDAHFVRDTISDGSKICAGYQFVQVWTMRNPGPNSWPAGCSLRHVGGDHMLDVSASQALSKDELTNARTSNELGRVVKAGEEVSFRVVMRAPHSRGTAISYWRLTKPDGSPFGHRLWCDILVVNPPTPPTMITPQQVMQMRAARAREMLKMPSDGVPSDASPCRPSVEQSTQMQSDKPGAPAQADVDRLARIQVVRKAAIERLMDARRKEYEAAALARRGLKQKLEAASTAPVQQEVAKAPAAESLEKRDAESKDSSMIFPVLDKESPASSTHEALSAPEPSTVSDKFASTQSELSEEEFFEDAESVDIRSFSSNDEGFMTDEEYDILDASDQESP